MKWTKLIDRVLVGFDGVKQNLYRTRAREYLYEAQEDFVLHTKCLEFLLTSDVVKDQFIVKLPDSYLDINRVEFRGDRLEYLPLWQDVQLYDRDGDWIIGNPGYYHIQGQELYIIPGAIQAGKLQLWCTGVFESAVGDVWEEMTDANWESNSSVLRAFTDQPYIQEPYQKYLIDYARFMIMDDEADQRSSIFQAKYQENREAIRIQILGRKTPIVSRIQDSLDSQTVFSLGV